MDFQIPRSAALSIYYPLPLASQALTILQRTIGNPSMSSRKNDRGKAKSDGISEKPVSRCMDSSINSRITATTRFESIVRRIGSGRTLSRRRKKSFAHRFAWKPRMFKNVFIMTKRNWSVYEGNNATLPD